MGIGLLIREILPFYLRLVVLAAVTLFIRAPQRRVKRIEEARKPRPSPIVIMCGSFNAFADTAYAEVMAGTLAGDFLRILDTLRRWESDGTWDRAHAG